MDITPPQKPPNLQNINEIKNFCQVFLFFLLPRIVNKMKNLKGFGNFSKIVSS